MSWFGEGGIPKVSQRTYSIGEVERGENLKSRGSLFYPTKDLLEEVEKYEKLFQKTQSLWIADMILLKKKTISSITAINKRWPQEVVKLL